MVCSPCVALEPLSFAAVCEDMWYVSISLTRWGTMVHVRYCFVSEYIKPSITQESLGIEPALPERCSDLSAGRRSTSDRIVKLS